jgi:hypothetical protein
MQSNEELPQASSSSVKHPWEVVVTTWAQYWLLMGAMLLCASGCMDFTEAQERFCQRNSERCDRVPPPPNTAPTITESSQSSTQVMGSDIVIFNVTAQDAETRELSFSWEASAGTLGTPSNTGTHSTVTWRAPLCVPGSSPVTITVTVHDDGAHSISQPFVLTVNDCPIPTITAGDSYSLALRGDGTVWAWGRNSYGQLGDGTTIPRSTPVQVSGLTGVTTLAAGFNHSLALRSDGTLWAWGANSGRLGDGTTTHRSTPVQVSGLTGVTALAAGQSHSLALRSDGTLWAWGANFHGQNGDEIGRIRLIPIQTVFP